MLQVAGAYIYNIYMGSEVVVGRNSFFVLGPPLESTALEKLLLEKGHYRSRLGCPAGT